MERRTDIDLMRGAAMVCVMIGHIFGTYLNAGSYIEQAQISKCIYDIIYSFHMPFMFLISGYVEHMVSTKNQRKQSVMRLFFVIMVPYFIFSFLLIIMNVIFGLEKANALSFIRVIIDPVSGLWFLYALFLFKILEMVISRLHINIWIVAILSFLAFILEAGIIQLPGILSYVCAFGFSYFVGYILYEKSISTKQYVVTIVSLLCGEIIYYNLNELLGKTLVGISLFIIIKGLLQEKNISIKPLEYIGLNCMVFYVIDGFTNSPISTILWSVGINNYWMVSLITLLVKLLIPYIIICIGKHSDFIMGFFYPIKWRGLLKSRE